MKVDISEPKSRDITVTMTEEEADILRLILSRVSGKTTAISSLYRGLTNANLKSSDYNSANDERGIRLIPKLKVRDEDW